MFKTFSEYIVTFNNTLIRSKLFSNKKKLLNNNIGIQ